MNVRLHTDTRNYPHINPILTVQVSPKNIVNTINNMRTINNTRTIRDRNRSDIINELKGLGLEENTIEDICNRELFCYSPERGIISAKKMFELFGKEIEDFNNNDRCFQIQSLSYIKDTLDVYNACYAKQFMFDYIIKLLNKEPDVALVIFKNFYKCVVNGHEGRIVKQKFDRPDNLKEIITCYFNIFEKNIEDNIPINFFQPEFLLNILSLFNYDNHDYGNFVDKIIEGFKSIHQDKYAKFFKLLVKSLNVDNSINDLDFLQTRIMSFIRRNNYLSKNLSGSFARFFRICADKTLRCNKLINKTAEFFNENYITIYTNSIHDQRAYNSQFDRYQVEIAIRILNKICKELKLLARQEEGESNQRYRELIENIKGNAKDGNDSSLKLKNDSPSGKKFYDVTVELKDFLGMLEYTRSMYYIVFNLLKDPDSHTIGPQLKYKDILLATVRYNLHLKKERINKDHEYTLLHPFIKNFITQDFYNQSEDILWMLFGLIEKMNHTQSYINLNTNEEIKKYEEINSCIKKFINSLYGTGRLLNQDGPNIEGGAKLYKEIIDSFTIEIQRQSTNPDIKKILGNVSNMLEQLNNLLKNFMSGGVKLINFNGITVDNILSVMRDEIRDDDLHSDMKTEKILKLANNFSDSFQEKLKIYGLFIKMIKPIFKRDSKNNRLLQTYFESEDKISRKNEFIRDMDRYMKLIETSSSKQITDVSGAIGTLLIKTLNKGINLDNPANSKYKSYDELASFLNSFDMMIEREKAWYKFILQDIFISYKNLNNLSNDNQTDNLTSFANELKQNYENKLSLITPVSIERYENNQIVAIYEAKRMVIDGNDSLRFFKIGTGNGKTLVQATIAIEYIKKYLNNHAKKVFIFTSFPHLAIRDRNSMEKFFTACLGNSGKSCVLNNMDDLVNLNQNTRIIFVDSYSFMKLVSYCALDIKHDFERKKDFFKLVYGNWNDHLILLDEFDVLLDVKEQHYLYYNGFSLFSDGKKSDDDAARRGTLQKLNQGKYHQINSYFKLNMDELDYDKGVVKDLGTSSSQTANQTNTIEAPIGAYLKECKQLNCLLPAAFSLKMVLTSTKVIGFSGSINRNKIGHDYGYISPNINSGSVFYVPTFFDPDNQINQNIKLYRYYCNPAQILCNDDLPGITNAEKHSALSNADEWLNMIAIDVKEALERKQPVIIFVNEINGDLDIIKNSLTGKSYNPITFENDEHAEDRNLQTIANEGVVAICTKKIGRGADIRMPVSIENGLHVIITRPDYDAEIIQEIGRTGRMNRKGSYSLIFKSNVVISEYEKDNLTENNNKLRISVTLGLSKKFYITNYTAEQLKYFVWFQNILYLCWYKWLEEHPYDNGISTMDQKIDWCIDELWGYFTDEYI